MNMQTPVDTNTASEPRLRRELRAFWFADIVGFTSLSTRDEEAALQAVELLRRHATEQVARSNGHLVKVTGDVVLADFASADAALESALALRDALANEQRPVALHFGVHLGHIVTSGDDIYGDSVNKAARLQAQAAAGQILVSEQVYEHVRATPGFRFSPVGRFTLKGLPKPMEAYGVERADTSAGPSVSTFDHASDAWPGGTRGQGTRLVVLPFRLLRPDADIDFLEFSLADAISSSLAKLQAIIVRSLSAAAQFAGRAADPRDVAKATDVDLVVAGTLLRVGERVQVTAELNDGRDGTLLGTYRSQAPLGDLFELQDTMTRGIVGALALPLTMREKQLMLRDVPATARAYELYLRANGIAHQRTDWDTARGLYEAAIHEDPTYAPAYAELGRCHRLVGKYGAPENQGENFARAQAAFHRALELNPDLDLAHGYAAYLDTEQGRCGDAMVRLLDRLATRPRGVELLAGLVHALRYCGLLDESLAAHHAARAIDASARTSVAYTHFLRGEYDAVTEGGGPSDMYIHMSVLLSQGREDEVRVMLQRARREWSSPILQQFIQLLELFLDGQTDASAELGLRLYRTFPDPEGRFLFARQLAWSGRTEQAFELIEGGADAFLAITPPGADPWLASIDRTERYARVLERTGRRRDVYRERFRAHPASDQIRAIGPAV